MFSEYTFICPPNSGVYVERAYAKVNLFLCVGGRRADGFHDIATLLQTVALHDRVEITWKGLSRGTSFSPPELRVTSDDVSVPRDADNLAGRAVEILHEAMQRRQIGGGIVRIHITKRIPIAAGLGGGSANAAAVLRALNRSFNLGLSPTELMDLGASIGSDVPACIRGGTLYCQGRGEKVTRVPSNTLWWVLGSMGGGLGAGEVYTTLDEKFNPTGRGPEIHGSLEDTFPGVRGALQAGSPEALAPFLVNDLERAVQSLDPRTADLVRRMKQMGAIAAFVSGSGPTVAGLAKDAATAKKIAEKIGPTTRWRWWGPSVDLLN